MNLDYNTPIVIAILIILISGLLLLLLARSFLTQFKTKNLNSSNEEQKKSSEKDRPVSPSIFVGLRERKKRMVRKVNVILSGLRIIFSRSFFTEFRGDNPSTSSDDRKRSPENDQVIYPSFFARAKYRIESFLQNFGIQYFFRENLNFKIKIGVAIFIPGVLLFAFFGGFFAFSKVVPNNEGPALDNSVDSDHDGIPDATEVNIFHTDPAKRSTYGEIDDANRELVYCPQFINCNDNSRDDIFMSNLSNITLEPYDWIGFMESNWSTCENCWDYPGIYGIWRSDPLVKMYSQKLSFSSEMVNETSDNTTKTRNLTYLYVNDVPLGINGPPSHYNSRTMSPSYYLTHGRNGTNYDSSNTGYVLLSDAGYNATLCRALKNGTRPLYWVEFPRNGTDSVFYSGLVMNRYDYYSTFSSLNISNRSITVIDTF